MTKIPDKAHLIMRIFVRANTGASMHVPERAKQIYRENQRATAKFKEYTFLVEKKQCKQYCYSTYTQKSQPQITLLYKATTELP